MSDAVTYERERGLARITLSRPESRNALSIELVESFNVALDRAAADAGARVVLLTALGPAFCAGMDLKTIALDDPAQADRFAQLLAETYKRLLMLPVPLLCGVDGPAMGGAVGLALAADTVWVGPQARFSFSETRFGLVPALVSVAARRRVPPGKLHALMLTAMNVGPEEAVRIGLAERTATESASAEAEAFAWKLLRENSSEAMARTKVFLQSQFAAELDRELADAGREFRAAVATGAASRGLKAFRSRESVRWDKEPEAVQ